MVDEVLDHVERAVLPWRAPDGRTECGRLPAEVKGSILTIEELVARYKNHGQQRTALTTCMICFDRARYNARWDQNPVGVLQRECQRSRDSDLFLRELRALAALVAEHRDEFDGYVAGLAETTSLAAARAKRRTR